MKKSREFYYHFKKNYVWLALNFLFLGLVCSCLFCYPAIIYWHQTWVLLGTAVFSFVLWGIKYLVKHRVALVDSTSIKIDHNKPLRWKDIAAAEYRTVRCCFRDLPVIALHPKEGLNYPYNLLQEYCAGTDFTAFSIPLYALTPEEKDEIIGIISKKVKFLNQN